MNLWKDIKTGSRPPEEIFVDVEIPNGSRNKYDFYQEWDAIHLDGVLYSPLYNPREYGLTPRSYYNSNDPKHTEYRDLSDVQSHFLREGTLFFEVFKRLEGKETTVIGWRGAGAAKERIQYSMDLFTRVIDV